jgi:hypothetical protein
MSADPILYEEFHYINGGGTMNKPYAALRPISWTPLVCMMLALLTTGCTREERGVTVAMKQIVDASGLVLEIPDGYFVEERSGTLVISPPVPKDLRIPPEVHVTAHSGALPEEESEIRSRRVGDQLVRYRVEHDPTATAPDGTSGYRFTAWLTWQGLAIEVRQEERNPRAEAPAFDLAWKVIEGIGRKSHARTAMADPL